MNGNRICFIDTNVWLYALIEGQDKTKARVARLLIQQSKPIVSPQIVNEVCANLVKRSQRTEEEIRLLIEAFYDKYPVIEPNKAVLIKASELRERHRFSYWDSFWCRAHCIVMCRSFTQKICNMAWS